MNISSVSSANSRLFCPGNITFGGKHKDCFGNSYSDDKFTSEFKRANGEIVGYNDKRISSEIFGLTRATVGAPITDETLKSMHINSLRDIGNNNLKGGLTGACEYVKELKDYGIKHFVMLCSPKECNILEECKKENVPITQIYMPVKDLSNMQDVQNFEKNIKTNRFIQAIKALREGNCFIGCESGNIRTKRFLAIVKILDPECKLNLKGLSLFPGDYACAKSIYEHLSKDEKNILGYTKQFESELAENIKNTLPKLLKF